MVFNPSNISTLNGIVGLYFIFTKTLDIQYPFKKSKLIYIGMSERKTNSIGKRLAGHYDGSSKNIGLTNFRSVEQLKFTYINYDVLKNFWKYRIEDLESYFILDFVKHYGVYPICNNKSGFEVLKKTISTNFLIDWENFE
ncbi:MAG: GIY-YIG nuclease family protein [Bacteroidales bacterium]|nr:GIY-YIG nuclease family protein [Bacteroidales bacterium]